MRVLAFILMANMVLGAFMALYLVSIHSRFGAGLYVMLQGIGTLISRTFMGKIMDRYGESPIIITSCITMVTALIGLSEKPGICRKRGCEDCEASENCPYRA